MAILKPSPSAAIRFATGTRQSLKVTIVVGWLCQPSFFSRRPKLSPGVPSSTMTHEMPPAPAAPVRTMQTYKPDAEPPEVKALVPLRT